MGYQVSLDDIKTLSERLALRKALLETTNRIYTAKNIQEILLDLKDSILSLLNAETIRIYAVDIARNDLYTLLRDGGQLKEARVPISERSVVGYAAMSGQTVNIEDAREDEVLRKIHPSMRVEENAGTKPAEGAVQLLAVPVFYESTLMGVVEIVNRRGGGKFTQEEQGFVEEVAEVLGIAFFNHARVSKKRRSRFDDLAARGLISEGDLENLWAEVRKTRVPIEELLMSRHRIPAEDIGRSLEDYYGCEFVPFSTQYPVPEELLRNLNKDYLQRELWVPLGKFGARSRVLIHDPNNILKRDAIHNLLKTKSIDFCVAFREDILKFINHFYARQEGNVVSITDLIGRMEPQNEEEEAEENAISESDSVIMQLVNKIINEAYVRRASDIHIEPNDRKKTVEIRYRIDGDCMTYQTLPFIYRAAVVSRIKIMANLDITERRLPQDGKIKFRRSKGEEIELRVATMPTQGNHEDVVLRILTKGRIMRLEDMALSRFNHDNLLEILEKPYGLILAVGPTGSGKTTTLHAALHHINRDNVKIWTIEDPIEITQEGVRQVQVNPKIGLDFARAMRSFLRADPDVIMVGEMRDFETAKIGIEASLTGHLVLSTLHTNSAPETVVRLLDMGIDPLNFADSLLGILAQRLAKCLCPSCKEVYSPSRGEYDHIAKNYGEEKFLKLNIPYNKDFKLYRPKGCPECSQTGYKGRVAVHELLVNTDRIKSLIQRHAAVDEIREAATEEGMTLLFQDGLHKVLGGLTDFDQVRRVCISAHGGLRKRENGQNGNGRERKDLINGINSR